jgi:hypothetical protein
MKTPALSAIAFSATTLLLSAAAMAETKTRTITFLITHLAQPLGVWYK